MKNKPNDKPNIENTNDVLNTPDFPEIDVKGQNTSQEKPQEVEAPLSEVDQLKIDLANSRKDYLYLRAEFDNFRKQTIKERSDLLRFGGENIARDLLNVLDVFEKALELEVTSDNFKSFLDGVQLTNKEFTDVFKKHGILEMDCKNKPFNPEQAEALSQIPSADLEEGLVYDVMRKGYLYHDKVLRHAQVVITTKPKPAVSTEES